MRFFQYSASDKQGQVVNGTIQAATSDDARLALTNHGLSVRDIRERLSQPQPQARPQVQVQPRPQIPAPKQVQPRIELAPQPRLNPVTGNSRKLLIKKTKKGSDKRNFFLFSQLASFFRAGMNPQMAFSELANRETRPAYREALREAAAHVGEGGLISDVLEAYPYLFPPDVAGTIKAGEISGFLPEAMTNVAEQMEISHRMKRRFTYFIFLFFFIAAVAPVCIAVVHGSLDTISDQWEHDGSLPPGATMAHHTASNLLHILPYSLLLFGLLWAGYAVWNSMRFRAARHRLVLTVPIISGRAKNESMARFAWVMSLASKAGRSAQQTMALGAASVPNLAIRAKLEASAGAMRENDRLSTAIANSNVLPEEHGHIVQTGEMVGDVPGALMNVASANDIEFKAKDSTVLMRMSFVIYPIFGIIVAVIVGYLVKTYYMGLFERIQ